MTPISESSKEQAPVPVKKRKKWTFWRILGWIILALMLIALVAAAYAWTHRYTLIEDAAREVLKEQGIESEMTLKSMTKTQMVIENVRLTADGDEFFAAETVTARYKWRDALDGKMLGLTFDKPRAHITVDEKGKIISGWMPPQDPNSQGTALPPDGIFVNDGTLLLSSPYGPAEIHINGSALSTEDFKANIKVQPGVFIYDDNVVSGQASVNLTYKDGQGAGKTALAISEITGPDIDVQSLSLNGDVSLDVSGDAKSLSGPFSLTMVSLSHPLLSSNNLTATGALDLQLTDTKVVSQGPINFTFDELITPLAKTGAGQGRWTGNLSLPRTEGTALKADGEWALDAKAAKLVDAARRRALAESLTLNSALSAAPVSEDFASGLTAMAEHAFAGANISAAGGLQKTQDRLSVTLTDKIHLTAPKLTLNLTPRKDAAFYAFDRYEKTLKLNMNAIFTGQYPARLNGMALSAKSENGYSLDGVTGFSTQVTTPQTWQSKTTEGRPVRLAPFKAKVDYRAVNTRVLRMIGGIDFDGNLPGGYATGLRTSGQLDVKLLGNGLSTTFIPGDSTPITMTKFETMTGWRGEDLAFRLVSDTPFFVRRGDIGTLDVGMENAEGILIDDADARHLGMMFDRVHASGTLKDGRQDWTMKAGGIKVCSDDLPGPGTDVRAAAADMTFALVPGRAPVFTLQSPSADIKSRLVNADHLHVNVKGTPDNFRLDYADGLIKFAAAALPPLPMGGDVTFADGEWNGSALTTLPKAEDAPINVKYRFKDGIGEADVHIEEITFSPNGFQPQALLPALTGKVSRVEGAASADIQLSFGEGRELESSGKVKIIDMDIGTLPGPMSGVNTEIEFSSFFPLQTKGRQKLTLSRFDPGLPLESGTFEYELIPNGVKLYSASWPMGDGTVSIDPAVWDFSAEENRVTLRVEKVSLGDFLANFGGGDIKATGAVVGVLPVVIKGVDVKVENGVIGVPEGGVIQFESRHTDAAGTVNETAQMAFGALKNFKYNSLEARLDGPLDGEITVLIDFIGYNPDVFYGTKFHFNISISGELVNIARSMVQTQDVLDLYKKSLLNEEKKPNSSLSKDDAK